MKAKSVWFSIWAMVALLLIQMGIGAIGIIPVFVKCLIEAHGSMEEFQQHYINVINGSGYMTVLELIATVVCAIIMVIWYYNGYYKKEKKAGTYKSSLPLFKDWKFDAFLVTATIGTFGLCVMIQVVTEALMPNAAGFMNDVMNMALGGNTAVALLAATIFAPIGEELAIRGIALRRCERAFGLTACMIITAILFGVMHMNPIQGLYAIPMGLVWAYIGYKTHSVIPCIVCHSINNLVGMLISDYIDPVQYTWVYAIIFVVFAVAAIFLGRKLDCL